METLVTRSEHTRSLADADKYRALEYLREVGLLLPLSGQETTHGRARHIDEGGDWRVDPYFSNGGNDTGNRNVNSRPTLYTSSDEVAIAFAQARAREKAHSLVEQYYFDYVQNAPTHKRHEIIAQVNSENERIWAERKATGYVSSDSPDVFSVDRLDDTSMARLIARRYKLATTEQERVAVADSVAKAYFAETHEIESWDTDAVVIDGRFKLSHHDDYQEYKAALSCLAIDYSVGSPVSFDDREDLGKFRTFIQEGPRGYIDHDKSVAIANKLGISEKLSLQLSSARNAQLLAMEDPIYLSNLFLRHSADIVGSNVGPLSMDYAQSYFRNAHIVGELQYLNSATLQRTIRSASLYDLEKATTRQDMQKGKIDMKRRLGLMAVTLGKAFATEVQSSHPLLRLMEDPHVKPEVMVDEASMVDGFGDIFGARAGVWEGYTLAEHTETVLRNFDENYADKLPVQLLLPMRLAILAHDIGKPIAAKVGDGKRDQQRFNIQYADRFFEQIGLGKARRLLLTTILGSGASLAAKVHIEKVDTAERALDSIIRTRLGEVFGNDMVADRHVSEYKELCKILVVCDGGAYTSMAITRKNDGSVFRNAASFNSSFARPIGFGKRNIRLLEDGDVSAPLDLTPQIQIRVS